jgi:predicted branched-subunit amino acid permease
MSSATMTLPAAPPVSTLRGAAWDGAKDIVPMTLSVVPFALTIGAVLASSSIGTVEALVSGPLILAGAAQLMAVQMLEDGAAPVVIVLSALLINARIVLYSAAMAPWFRQESVGRRLLLAVPLIDQLYFTCAPRFERGDLDRRHRQAYYAGAAALLVAGWVVAQSVAILAGARVPEGVGLQIGAPLALAGLLAKSTANRPAMAAAAAAAFLAVVAVGLPNHSSVLVSAVGGIAVGAAVARSAAKRSARRNDPWDERPDERCDECREGVQP